MLTMTRHVSACPALQASAGSTVPGTPADLSREVQSCLEMMRATRFQLADRLAHSQATCAAMIADCDAAGTRAGGVAGGEGEQEQAAAFAFGSPAAPSSSAASQQGKDEGVAEEQEEEPAVLGVSRRHHANLQHQLQQSPSPVKKAGGRGQGDSQPAAGEGSMRRAWEAAHERVAEVRAQHTSWDLAGFVRDLGFEVSC